MRGRDLDTWRGVEAVGVAIGRERDLGDRAGSERSVIRCRLRNLGNATREPATLAAAGFDASATWVRFPTAKHPRSTLDQEFHTTLTDPRRLDLIRLRERDRHRALGRRSCMSLQDEIDARRKEIQTEGYPMSIGELVNLYRDDELDIHPEFQRFFRWTDRQKSRFIESLLLGIPIPSIFVNQRADGVWDVIDGLQRLSTVFEFMGELRDEDGESVAGSRLTATDYLPSLENRSWAEDDQPSLNDTQRRLVKRAALDLKIIKRESDPDTPLELFQRLNTLGSQLSDQELRNSLLIMVKRDYYFWLSDLQTFRPFQIAIAVSDRSQQEQYDLELILRFLAASQASVERLRAVGDMAEFLTNAAVSMARDEEFDADSARATFEGTFAIIAEALDDQAFHRYDADRDRFLGGFSVSAFEAVSTGVAAHLEGWQTKDPAHRSQELTRRVKDLWVNETFRQYARGGVRARTRIPQVVPLGRELFAP